MKHALPPSPPWGRLQTLRRMAADDTTFFRTLHEDYGEVVSFRLPSTRYCAVSSVEGAREALVDKVEFLEVHHPRTAYDFVKSKCLARTQIGDEHRRLTELVRGGLTPDHVDGFRRLAAAETACLADELQEVQEGKTVDGRRLFERFTWNALAACLLGGGQGLADAAIPALKALKLNWISAALGFYPVIRKLPLPHDLKARKKIRPLDEATYESIRKARNSGGDGASLVAHFVRATENGTADWSFANDEEIRDEAYGILFGAFDHPTRALTRSPFHLAANPEVRSRLEAEVTQVAGDRPLQGEDIDRLPYTRAVCMELLRFHPAGALLAPRKAMKDLVLGGYHVPKGTLVVVTVDVINNRTDYWEDPAEFRPERWLESNGCPHGDAFLTFSMEPRHCRGVDMAAAVIVAGLARVAQNWRLDPVPGEAPTAGLMPGGFGGPVPFVVSRRP